ncbi:MAG: extensin, partial [Xanthobacteraceae bacterium]
MSRGVQLWLFGSLAAAALAALAGCSHNFYSGERETWRREAEASCINSGTVKESPERVRISAISGPGMCGADFPIRVSALGDGGPLGYDDEPVRPPGSLPSNTAPQHWPVVQSSALPPPQYGSQQYGSQQNAASRPSPVGPMQATASAPGRPMSLYPPGVPDPGED